MPHTEWPSGAQLQEGILLRNSLGPSVILDSVLGTFLQKDMKTPLQHLLSYSHSLNKVLC